MGRRAKKAAGRPRRRPPPAAEHLIQEGLDHLDQGISAVDGNLELVLFNRRFMELLDLPPELARIGTPFEDFVRFNAERGEYGPGDVNELVRQRVELARRFEPHRFERIRPDGTVIEVRSNPLPGGSFATTYTDITEPRRAEEELRRLAAAVEELDVNFSLYDADDRLVICNQNDRDLNRAVVETLTSGATFEEHIRAAVAKGLVLDAVGREEEWVRQRLERHRNPRGPFEFQREDDLWLLMHEQRLPDGSTITIGTDITERKRLETEAAERIKRLQRLSELSMTIAGEPADVFDHVVRMIGELFDVDVVCLSEIRGDELHFISVWADGEVTSDAGHCPLEITPCATVEGSKDLRTYDRVTERFPEASFLRTHDAYSYCGFPSLDNAGDVVAVTCLLDDKPHEFLGGGQGYPADTRAAHRHGDGAAKAFDRTQAGRGRD